MLVNDNDVTIKRLCLLKDLFKNYIPDSKYLISYEVLKMRKLLPTDTVLDSYVIKERNIILVLSSI